MMRKSVKGGCGNSDETVQKAIAHQECTTQVFFQAAAGHCRKKGVDPVGDSKRYESGTIEAPDYVMQYAVYLAAKNIDVLATPVKPSRAPATVMPPGRISVPA